MKKNRMMRLASILLVLVLMTSSVVGGTFAKYTTSATVTDTARVAYWGFGRAAATTFDLFDGVYVDATNGTTVKSNVNVVAPGTAKDTEFAFAYTDSEEGPTAPEVAYTFVVDADITGNYTALDNNENFKWTLDGKEYATVALLLKAIEDLDGNKNQNRYEAGVLPEGFGVDDSHTIGWAWAFETANDVDTNNNGIGDQDEVDTAMGNATDLADVSITITITATQID